MANNRRKSAKNILSKMYQTFMENITKEQWQKILDEIKSKYPELDGAELEETAKANIMARLVVYARRKGDKKI